MISQIIFYILCTGVLIHFNLRVNRLEKQNLQTYIKQSEMREKEELRIEALRREINKIDDYIIKRKFKDKVDNEILLDIEKKLATFAQE